ncbi:MAG: metallophosphoesterase [Bacteroidales bacterium]|nr:metallophosphoesterase [Bacteroidales bacterium]
MIRISIFILGIWIATQLSDKMNTAYTKEPGDAVLSFGLIADVQYCDCISQGSRYFSKSLNKLNEALDDFNTSDIDFIINLGDLIEEDFRSFKPVMAILENSNKKVFHLTGNHDYSVKRKFKKEVNTMLTGENTYYSFTSKGFRFIVLNSCEVSTYSGSFMSEIKANHMLTRLQRDSRPNAFDWNGALSRKQIRWLESELTEAHNNNEHVLIFSHHTVEPAGTHNIYNREEILQIISGYDNIVAWFSGHKHEGGYSIYKDIHFITLKAMVESPDSNSWAIVEIYDDILRVNGRGREESRVLTY